MGRTVVDLDDRDLAVRDALRLELTALRLAAGLSQRQVAIAMGSEASLVRGLERAGVLQSRTGTVLRWARALGKRVIIEPVGFPPPAKQRWPSRSAGVEGLLATIAQTEWADRDEWVAAGIAADLAGIRVACGITQTELADVLGISEQAVSILETAGTDTMLVVLQRYARGLARCSRRPDAHLHVRLHDS